MTVTGWPIDPREYCSTRPVPQSAGLIIAARDLARTPDRCHHGVVNDNPEPDTTQDQQITVYQAVGGQGFFDELVRHFYEHVAHDDVLLRLYPDQQNLEPARERLALFLGQYWGGPDTYSQQRGHPRLRMRHAPYVIGATERDHWVHAMLLALDSTMSGTPLSLELQETLRDRMREYFEMSAQHLLNSPESLT
ncbi:MAG: globin [Actinobacteria bacterium]|nr:globin [Actinomycetota bacterium]